MSVKADIIPRNEAERQAAVNRYDILDTPADGHFDAITSLAARVLDVPIAIVSIVDRNRIWFKSRYGVDATEVPRDPGLCASAILQDDLFILNDTRLDPHALANPLVAGDLGLRFYAGAPLTTADGYNLGTMCVLDRQPRDLSSDDSAVLKQLAGLVVRELDLRMATRQIVETERRFHAQLEAEVKERRDAEQALRQSETTLSAVLTTAMDAIVVFDSKHSIKLYNCAAELAFGYPSAEVLNTRVDRLFSDDSRHVLQDFIGSVTRIEGKPQFWAPEGLVAIRSSGEEFPVELTLSNCLVDSEQMYTIILRDINERQGAQDELLKLRQQTDYLREEIRQTYNFEGIVARSPQMQKVLRNVERVAPTRSTVLITGETGVGKELIARAIHARSTRKDQPLVKLNCAALPGDLIETELFGHEKGAFTGAISRRAGRFELANNGTLFLDEVGELTPQAQAKVLRALQEGEFERVGGSETIRVDVRLIAATNRDLGEMVADQTFRGDLYYRLNVFPLRIPPLRERVSDIPELSQACLKRFAGEFGRPLEGLAPQALEQFRAYLWPGNVRELQNVIERCAILADGPLLAIPDGLLPSVSQPPAQAIQRGDSQAEGPTLDAVQKDHITGVLDDCNWQIEGRRGAAAALGLKPSTLRYRMRKLGIEKRSNH